MTEQPKVWQIGRAIPVAFLAMLAVQTGSVIWFAAKMDARIEANKASVVRIEMKEGAMQRDLDAVERSLGKQAITLGEIGITLTNLNKTLDAVNRKLDR